MARVANVVVVKMGAESLGHVATKLLGGGDHACGIVACVDSNALARRRISDEVHEILHLLCHGEDSRLLSSRCVGTFGDIDASEQLAEEETLVA